MSADDDVAMLIDAVRGYIDPALDALHARIDQLQLERGEKGDKGDPGKDGKDGERGDAGKDGADGFGFDDLSVDYDGERGFAVRFAQGDRVKEFRFQMPAMIYRGVWSGDDCYGAGDTVTWGGSLWVCNAATAAQPDDGVNGWTKAVRRGRDGRNGKDGERGPPGIDGRPGRDLMMDAVR